MAGPPKGRHEPPALDSRKLFGMEMANATLEEVLACIDRRIASRTPGYILTPNVDHVVRYQRDSRFRAAYDGAFLRLPDGMPIIFASRLAGKPLRAKLSGSDLVYWLSEHAAQTGARVFLFGAAEGVAEDAARRLAQQYPGLHVAGTCSPPMGFDSDPMLRAEAIARIKAASPDICFVALSVPRQEYWIAETCEEAGVPVQIGVGASLDFVTGRQRRAPVLMQHTGLEWLWRLMWDPKRLWRRYLVDDLPFAGLIWREWRARRSA